MLDLFLRTQEKVKEAYGFQGPSLGTVLKPVLGGAAGGALAGGTLGGLGGALTSETPEDADADALKGLGIGALAGGAAGALGGGVAGRQGIKDFAKYSPVRKLMGQSEKFKQQARSVAKMVDDEADPGIADTLKDMAYDLAGKAKKTRDEAVRKGVDIRYATDKTAGERKRSVLDRLRGRNKKEYHYLFGKRIGGEEAGNIERVLKERQPRTEAEQNIQQIVGARPTAGQVGRAATVGALGGVGTHVLGSAIEGGNKWLPDMSEGVVKGLLKNKGRAVLHPRSLGRAAVVGGILTGGLPIAKKLWDIQTARESPESF